MEIFIKSFLILLLIYQSTSKEFEVVHYTIDRTSYSFHPLFLTIFTKESIPLSDIRTLNLEIFDFKSDCKTLVKAVSFDEDPFTKNDCQYYFRVNYETSLSTITLPDSLIGNDEYKIKINKALIKKTFSLNRNFNNEIDKRILIIEDYFNSLDNGNTFNIQTKIPFCKNIFSPGGSKYQIAVVNSKNAEYNCNFNDISNYLNNVNNFTCVFKTGLKQLITNDISFDVPMNDDDIIYFISSKITLSCDDEEKEKKNNVLRHDIISDPYYLYYSNERNGVFYIFYDTNKKLDLSDIKIYGKLNKNGFVDISSYCQPGLSRYLKISQFTCSINLKDVFKKERDYLINSDIQIYVSYKTENGSINNEYYKTYRIKRGFEQPYFRDFVDTMERVYKINGETI